MLGEIGHVRAAVKVIERDQPGDADRDPDGLISDDQVERDIEQLQRDNVEEQHIVAPMNGNGKTVHDNVYELMVKSLSGLHVETEEPELRRRCDEVALEVPLGGCDPIPAPPEPEAKSVPTEAELRRQAAGLALPVPPRRPRFDPAAVRGEAKAQMLALFAEADWTD